MDLLESFEEYLHQNPIQIKTFHPFYQEALNYMLQGGGKRFRPLLLLHVVQAYEPLLVPSAMPVALALEIFHTYSLIHDDLPVMDDAALRRGKETLHKKYDELTAVLVGDALNTHAFYLISSAPLHPQTKSELTKILAINGGADGMVHGQILDCYFEDKRLTIEELKTLHCNKTAKLIAASLQMGGVIADLDPKKANELYDFGIELGILFQIQDDIIDAICSSEEAGKTTQNDTHKNSFINLLGLEKSLQEADRYAVALEKKLASFDEKLQQNLATLLQKYLYRHKKEC
ncbi:polyprenyl synthetase family protein [Nitratiruptor sp. YY09-18]|uniref:polyprenyl synthetase family protein n=1 Tax=Nitratiruptor sp. YY09-18 TaxID=2724901 RepID=UPI001915C353|nr:polyprenyl synthetase family protein [Nitratiruptor sp. YY09-18]BCD67393.1 farnesyl diphosphate synthase [Nitratiruptor sp. YY09-18]